MLRSALFGGMLVLAHVLGGAEAATDFRLEKELKAATFLMETVTGADCEASPPEGTPVMVQLTTEFTNGTKVGAHQRYQNWHAHSPHDIEELNDAPVMGFELYQYAADGVSVFENMCVGEKRKITLTPHKGKTLRLHEYSASKGPKMGQDVGTVNYVELLKHGHGEEL